MIRARTRLLGATLAVVGLGAFGTDYPDMQRVRREPGLSIKRNRREWMKYRATKTAFDPWKRGEQRKAQRRARRATRLARK